MSDRELIRQINKRLTLNLLIQGSAAHAFLFAHYLVEDELKAIDPALVSLYDRFSVNVNLAQWISDLALVFGTSRKFWSRIAEPDHPFSSHPLLAKHGPMLAVESRRFCERRAKEKRTSSTPGLHTLGTYALLIRVYSRERQHRWRLQQLATKAVADVWGIEPERMQAKLTTDVEFGSIRESSCKAGRLYRRAAAGWGGVQRVNGRFVVVARAWTWSLLVHELIKGTTELVCLHGLNQLDDGTYDQVMRQADRIEYEVWMLQAGGELWRRLLRVLPKDRPLAECIMRIARLGPDALETLMINVIESPDVARTTLQGLGAGN